MKKAAVMRPKATARVKQTLLPNLQIRVRFDLPIAEKGRAGRETDAAQLNCPHLHA